MAQKLLLCKGPTVTPRTVVVTIHGRMKTCEVIAIMNELATEGAGYLQGENRKLMFVKKEAHQITDILDYYNISQDVYMEKYLNLPRT